MDASSFDKFCLELKAVGWGRPNSFFQVTLHDSTGQSAMGSDLILSPLETNGSYELFESCSEAGASLVHFRCKIRAHLGPKTSCS